MTVAQLQAILANVKNKNVEVVVNNCMGKYTPVVEPFLHEVTYVGDAKYTNTLAEGEKEVVLIIE